MNHLHVITNDVDCFLKISPLPSHRVEMSTVT